MSQDAETYDPDPERAELLRAIADDIRRDSSESKLLAAILYRISDLFDPDEDTSARDIYINMREIIRTKDTGGKR